MRPTPAQLRALRRLMSPDYLSNGAVFEPRWAGISKATLRALVTRGWARECGPPELWGLRITAKGRVAVHECRDYYGDQEPVPDVLDVPWYVQPNDLIGGWCVTDGPYPPSVGALEIADFISEETARHIASLHNLSLIRRLEARRRAEEGTG